MNKAANSSKLNNGQIMPLVGLGTYLLNSKEEMTNLLRTALDAGYRHIDTAVNYQNEAMIGESLKTIFKEGKYSRKDLFIVSKVFPNKGINMLESVKKSLKELQLDYVDLYYLHFPLGFLSEKEEFVHLPVHVAWAQLEEAHRLGLAKSIGVSNFNVMALADLLSYAKVKPVSNQVEVSVFIQQKNLIKFCQRFGIHVTAYAPLAKYTDVESNPILQKIAKKHKITISQVLLGFLLNQGLSVIPKTDKPSRLKENIDSINVKLSEEDFKELETLNKNQRTIDPSVMAMFSYVPFFD
ncbi:aldo/keto reductase family oxidoreductase (macronuclear) [Tetrahymena thermophila SB210]|uniref:Aldo/keto reductase family oxidoreductase n=1 Tax=Tetrahymena thermophila (strain SB210) TaxID=312017 RepID=Q235Q6_TETTS|nr:aldo/keto reductase family oxidoreductase [Tetrahymena thermophila SB210]EAR92224.1 aldo/keto reductase family oxidoreductase [Tetrahymena thermophila SB210]|eukprot:XP_001012469.1 aldo/keto reductase family oxidoreductase [Tetrahymena thermophila SB210]